MSEVVLVPFILAPRTKNQLKLTSGNCDCALSLPFMLAHLIPQSSVYSLQISLKSLVLILWVLKLSGSGGGSSSSSIK